MNIEPQEQPKVQVHYHSKQKEIFFDSPAKTKVIAKGRRFGLTKGFANRAIEYLVDGISPGLWVDTVYGNIERYVERYFMPVLAKIPKKYWQWRQQRKELEIFGHKLDMRSADKPENIEGFAYKFIMLNEAGIILRNDYLYNNTILPMTLDFNPDFFVGGTPKGKGLFHQLAVKAQDNANEKWQFFHYTSYDNPYIEDEAIDELANQLPEAVKKQEIYAEFLEDVSAVFMKIEQAATASFAEPAVNKRYYLGVDLGRLQDFTVLNVMDEGGNQVYMDRFKDIDWQVQRERIRHVAERYYNAQIWVDATGIGDPIYEDLVNMNLNVQPYKFTNQSKKQLIQALMISLEQEKVRIFKRDGEQGKVQFNEMVIFEYEMTASGLIRYNAPEGFHDDCVIALALANWGVQNGGASFVGWSKESWRD